MNPANNQCHILSNTEEHMEQRTAEESFIFPFFTI